MIGKARDVESAGVTHPPSPPLERDKRHDGEAGRRGTPALHAPRGSVLILAIGITVVLAGLVLVFARQMRVEALISGNLQSGLQANTIADGAARHVINQLANNTDYQLATLDTTIQSQAVTLGNGKFWIVRPDPTDERQYAYGIVDEASKLNLNDATLGMLTLLPDMPPRPGSVHSQLAQPSQYRLSRRRRERILPASTGPVHVQERFV